MINEYMKLIKLQHETDGASFTLCYSKKRMVHIIRFNNLHKKFEDSDVKAVILKAIVFIQENRRQILTLPLYTLFKC